MATYTADQRAYARRLGQRITRARRRAGYSKGQLERQTGIRHPRQVAYEQGRVIPRLAALETLAAAFGIPVECLINDPEPRKEHA